MSFPIKIRLCYQVKKHLKCVFYLMSGYRQSCTDIAFCRLYRYRMQQMTETAETDYAADYVTDYERPIMSRYFERTFLNNPKKLLFNRKKFQTTFYQSSTFSLSHRTVTFSMILGIGGAIYSYRYRLQPIVLIINRHRLRVWPMYQYSSSYRPLISIKTVLKWVFYLKPCHNPSAGYKIQLLNIFSNYYQAVDR